MDTAPKYAAEYSRRDLQILWYVKRAGGKVVRRKNESVLNRMSADLSISLGGLRYGLRDLEVRCLILRRYNKEVTPEFGGARGVILLSVELIDPDMYLPPLPPLPLATVVARENEDLAERVAHDPTAEEIILALLKRNEELQRQVDKLRDIVDQQAKQMLAKKADLGHLTGRIKDALTPEQWEALRHSPERR